MSLPLRFCFPVLFTLAGTLTLSAANRTWTGAVGDWDFSNGLNWSGNTAPADNDYADTAIFNASATAGTVNVPAARSIRGITFESAGWTLSGAAFSNLNSLTSSGAGTNTFNQSVNVHSSGTGVSWSVSSGNTLAFAAGFYQRDKNINLAGGGVVEVGASITGFSGTLGSWGLYINDATTVRFTTSTPYHSSSAGAVFIRDASARVQILTSVAAAELMIGGRIRDGVGAGLQVADLGNGYVEITSLAAIPEPSACALLLGAGILGLLLVRRRLNRRHP